MNDPHDIAARLLEDEDEFDPKEFALSSVSPYKGTVILKTSRNMLKVGDITKHRPVEYWRYMRKAGEHNRPQGWAHMSDYSLSEAHGLVERFNEHVMNFGAGPIAPVPHDRIDKAHKILDELMAYQRGER